MRPKGSDLLEQRSGFIGPGAEGRVVPLRGSERGRKQVQWRGIIIREPAGGCMEINIVEEKGLKSIGQSGLGKMRIA